MPWAEGEAQLLVTVATPAGSDTARARRRLTRQAVDTAPHQAPPDPALFRAESRKGDPVISSLLRGLAFGGAAAGITGLANSEIGVSSIGYAAPVAASVTVAGLVGVFAGRRDVPIAENIEHNRALRAAWQDRNRATAAANERTRTFAPLRVQVIP